MYWSDYFRVARTGEKEQGSALSVVVLTGGRVDIAAKEGCFRGMRKEKAPSTMHIGTFYWINRI